MSKMLLINDNDRRARQLASELNFASLIEIRDLYSEVEPSEKPDLLIVDIDTLDSRALLRLKTLLVQVRGRDVPLLFLSHGNAARAQIQSVMIQATENLSATSPVPLVQSTIASMWEQACAQPPQTTVRLANDARRFLDEVFFSGEAITPELATVGTDLISQAVLDGGVGNWVSVVQRFDNATYKHCLLVSGLAVAFATALGLGRRQSFRLTKAALLHDVGKTQVPISILNKPGPLNSAEMTEVRTHAVKGFELLSEAGFSGETLIVARSHHELLDGSGYPDGLRNEAIPDLVRLVTICDIFGALIERRPYKSPMSAEKAYSILVSMTGRLDADLVKIFHPVVGTMA